METGVFCYFYMVLNWIFILGVFAIIILLFYRWSFFRKSNLSPKFLSVVFALKFMASLLLAYIYTHHYTDRSEADIFKYFDDSQHLHSALYSEPIDYMKMMTGIGDESDYFFTNYYVKMNNWDRALDANIYNDSHTIIRTNAFVRLFSLGIYEVHCLFFCFLSMIGTVALFRASNHHFLSVKNVWVLVLFLLPSVFLWTSGVLKESILMFGLGLLLFAVKKLLRFQFSVQSVLLGVLTLFLLFYIKFYVLIAFLPAILCFVVAKKINKHPVLIYTPLLLLFGFLTMNSKHIPPHIDLMGVLERKQSDFMRLAELQNAGSTFELTTIDSSFWGIAKVVPEGLLNCFIRPLPWKANSIVYYPAVLENLMVLVMLFTALFYSSKRKFKTALNSRNFLWFCLTFSLLLYTIIGITTPVSGALVRYKVPALPFLISACLITLKDNKWVLGTEIKVKKWKIFSE